ncbi:hypothetical protein ACHAXR_006860, partial [Thalassiosira sp. AJA248-18]
AKDKDTGNFALCLLENWSSAVMVTFVWGLYSMLLVVATFALKNYNKQGITTTAGYIFGSGGSSAIIGNIHVGTRLLTRLGAAAALHQFPSLLFELRRDDRPRPLCRLTTYMRRGVRMLFDWLPLGVASDLTVLLCNNRRKLSFGTTAVPFGTMVASFLSILAPVCHLVALGRIVRLSKCSAVSLSEATSFPTSSNNYEPTRVVEEEGEGDGGSLFDKERQKIQWRYQLRWRTPQRIAETLRSWANYFFTGHVPLLFELDEWKRQPIEFDDFSTEGTRYLINKYSQSSSGEEEYNNTMNHDDELNDNDDDLTPHVEAIAESLSLIFRDRDAAIRNATQARLSKHQESYDTKTLDDVLGVAVQQTFGIGVSYEFDHFDSPEDLGEEVSIHQLRARMAKSAVRRKRELDGSMKKELDVLRRLKENVVTAANKEVAEKEMKSVETGIRERHAQEAERMRNALLTMIPTNTDDAPKGTERYENPIMVAEYVDLKAPVDTRRGELTATVESAPDALSMIEDYVRRDYGDEAADAYRRDEIAARRKEKEMLTSFRQRYGELKEDEMPQSGPTPPAGPADDEIGDSSDTGDGA